MSFQDASGRWRVPAVRKSHLVVSSSCVGDSTARPRDDAAGDQKQRVDHKPCVKNPSGHRLRIRTSRDQSAGRIQSLPAITARRAASSMPTAEMGTPFKRHSSRRLKKLVRIPPVTQFAYLRSVVASDRLTTAPLITKQKDIRHGTPSQVGCALATVAALSVVASEVRANSPTTRKNSAPNTSNKLQKQGGPVSQSQPSATPKTTYVYHVPPGGWKVYGPIFNQPTKPTFPYHVPPGGWKVYGGLFGTQTPPTTNPTKPPMGNGRGHGFGWRIVWRWHGCDHDRDRWRSRRRPGHGDG